MFKKGQIVVVDRNPIQELISGDGLNDGDVLEVLLSKGLELKCKRLLTGQEYWITKFEVSKHNLKKSEIVKRLEAYNRTVSSWENVPDFE